MMSSGSTATNKMTSANFSKLIRGVDDLYNAALRNGYFLPKQSSSAINEVTLVNILNKEYWCPKTDEIRIKNCVKAPVKETLFGKLETLCFNKKFNISWMDMEKNQLPDKKWMVDVIATLNPDDEIFKKDYVAPPIRKRLRDIETIVLPNEIFEGLPQSTSKLKARRMKIMSEAFAAEKAQRNRDLQKELYEQMVEQEARRDKLNLKLKAKDIRVPERIHTEEEKKNETQMRP